MKRVKGSEGVSLMECINPAKDKWHVRWDVQPADGTDGTGNPETGVTYMEEEFPHKPMLAEVRELVTGWLNACIDGKILSGFSWNGMPVWLSTENQFNYKAAYDLAVQTGAATLPVTFKFGTDEAPAYHTFTAMEELEEFYVKSVTFIQTTLSEGWTAKDNFDYTPYQEVEAD